MSARRWSTLRAKRGARSVRRANHSRKTSAISDDARCQRGNPGADATADLPAIEVVGAAVSKFLRSFQALILSTRLYDEGHSLTIAAAESAEQHLHEALMLVVPVAIRIDESFSFVSSRPG